MQGASVVSCPCCYGGVTTSLGVVTYPRSQVTSDHHTRCAGDIKTLLLQMFSAELTAESFFTVAHCADQTHAGDCKAEQGYTCMDLVDTDRWDMST